MMPTDQPIISVLIPAHNVETFVEESLVSIQTQTVREIELVVINDGSTDRTREILLHLASRDSRILVLSTPVKTGIVGVLNLGLRSCRAPYIARMDADDIASPDWLEKQLQFLESHPDVALVGSATKTINESGVQVGTSYVPTTDKAIAKCLVFAPPCNHIWLARRELYRKLGGYRDLPTAEDYDFLLRAVTSGFKLANLPEPLMSFRIRSGNTGDTAGLKQRKTHSYVLRLYRERLKEGKDSFSHADYEQAIRSSAAAAALHRCASRLVRSAFSKPGMVRRLSRFALAAAISPWQAQYFWHRFRWHLLARVN
jgi:glycosyltransferase involved in cell wall biosynthesis